jgi:hypothetical protein
VFSSVLTLRARLDTLTETPPAAELEPLLATGAGVPCAVFCATDAAGEVLARITAAISDVLPIFMSFSRT